MIDILQEIIFGAGGGFCHQLPARSYFFSGLQMPLCARCSGIYIGFVVPVLLLTVFYRGRQRRGWFSLEAYIVLAIFVLLMVFDGLSSYAGFRESNNVLRIISGSAFGVAVGSFSYQLVSDTIFKNAVDEPAYSCKDGSFWLLFLAPIVTIALHFVLGYLSGHLLLFTLAAFLIGAFSYVMLVVVGLFPRYEQAIEGWRDMLVPGFIALMLGLLLCYLVYLFQSWLHTLAP